MVAIIPAETANKTIPEKNISFHWVYILLPAAILLISIILAVSFYSLLPPEVAYRFAGGEPSSWMGRGAIITWLLVPQFLLVIAGSAVSGGGTIVSRRSLPAENTQVTKLLSIMGNIVVLPQIILAFAMLDIFLYNSYRIHLMPVWVFAVIVMVLGGIILGILFIQALRQFRGPTSKSLEE